MRARTIAVTVAGVVAIAVVPQAAVAASPCPQKQLSFKGELALPDPEKFGAVPGEPVTGGKLDVDPSQQYVTTSRVVFTYEHVKFTVADKSKFSLSCFKKDDKGGYRAGRGSLPLLALSSGDVDVDGSAGAPSEVGVSMRYGLFHATPAKTAVFRVSFDWVRLAEGKGRAELKPRTGSKPVGFSPGSVAALKGTCRAGETMIVDWKGVRTKD